MALYIVASPYFHTSTICDSYIAYNSGACFWLVQSSATDKMVDMYGVKVWKSPQGGQQKWE